jgi:hypothetical protein
MFSPGAATSTQSGPKVEKPDRTSVVPVEPTPTQFV